MKNITKVRGFILKKRNLLNKDIQFTAFTQEQGKLSIIAKGIKKITSRRAPHIQTGNLVDLELYNRGEIQYLQNSNLVSAFSAIRESEIKTNFLFLYLFILDRILPEYQHELLMYAATQAFIFDMGKAADFTQDQFTIHLHKLLAQAGYVSEKKTLSELIRVVEEVINEKVPGNII